MSDAHSAKKTGSQKWEEDLRRGACPRNMSRTRGSTVSNVSDRAHQIRAQKVQGLSLKEVTANLQKGRFCELRYRNLMRVRSRMSGTGDGKYGQVFTEFLNPSRFSLTLSLSIAFCCS